MDINEHSRLIASGSKDRTVKLWSLNIHHGIENSLNEPYSECLKTYTGHRKNTIVDVHFISGGGSWGLGNRVVSCDGQVHVNNFLKNKIYIYFFIFIFFLKINNINFCLVDMVS